jgi:hypothetical protein
MFKKVFLVVFITSLILGCADNGSVHPLFLSIGEKVDCGNGKRMISYELCRLDASGY